MASVTISSSTKRKPVTMRKARAPAKKKYELPTKPKEPVRNFYEYITLLYGRQKIGKTTACAGWPDVLMLPTEPGTKAMRVYQFPEKGYLTDWEQVLACVELLENTDRFKSIAIDTVVKFYDLCLKNVCKRLGISHPQDVDDWGKSWGAIKTEFEDIIYRITATGRGLVFTSHAKEEAIKPKGGESYTRIYPRMSGQAREVVESLVDFFYFADYFRDSANKVRRVIVTQGDEMLWAGCRETLSKVDMPLYLPLEKENTYNVLEQAFHGKHPGINPEVLRTGASTSKAASLHLGSARAAGKVSKVGKASKFKFTVRRK